VRRYIWLLRQKFEADPANSRWICIARFGYRMGTSPNACARRKMELKLHSTFPQELRAEWDRLLEQNHTTYHF
jgi:hypothetical protein